jgi:hypothetical protein
MALLVLIGCALLPVTASALGGRSYLELSSGYMSGDFGTPTTSRLFTLTPTLGYVASRHDLSITVPYLALTNETGGASSTETGLGDIIGRAGAVLVPQNPSGLSVNGAVAVKFPTADESRGLGSGETDYGVYASVHQRLQAFKLSVMAGYLRTGDPPGLDYRDGFSFGIGVARSFSRTTLYGAFEQRQAVSSGFANPQEVSAGFFHLLNADYAVKGQVFFGLTHGGPDGGATLGVVRWF